MSLLEALVALVILGLTGVGFLETFQAATRSSRDAAAWTSAVAYAESGVEGAVAGADVGGMATADSLAGFRREVAWRRWDGAVDELTVTVTMPSGARFVLRRLVARAAVGDSAGGGT